MFDTKCPENQKIKKFWPYLYSLVNLGFRASGFEIREGSKTTAPPKSTARVTTRRHSIKKKPTVVRKTASEPQRLVQNVRKPEER